MARNRYIMVTTGNNTSDDSKTILDDQYFSSILHEIFQNFCLKLDNDGITLIPITITLSYKSNFDIILKKNNHYNRASPLVSNLSLGIKIYAFLIKTSK